MHSHVMLATLAESYRTGRNAMVIVEGRNFLAWSPLSGLRFTRWLRRNGPWINVGGHV